MPELVWVYIGLLGVLLGIIIAGEITYMRAFTSSGVKGMKAVIIVRSINLALLVIVLVGGVIFMVVRGG